MFTLQVLDNISPAGLALLDPQHYQIDSHATNPDAILVRSYKLHEHPFTDTLKAVARAGAGTDNIPVAKLTERGIPVFYAPGANANAVKELVMAAMLMGYRNLAGTKEFITQLEKENDQQLHQNIETRKKQFVGHEIAGKTLGVIGLGQIGVKVANTALALGMNVLGYDPGMTLSNALALMPQIQQAHDLAALLSHSDIITVHVPLSTENNFLINQDNIKLIQPQALLLNFSREKIVEESAVLQQLNNNLLMGYITDFPTINLASHPKVICFPHLGASTLEAEQNCAERVIRTLDNYLQQGIIEYCINFPNISLTPIKMAENQRIIIFNQNMPGVIGNVTQLISKMGYNIEQMENKSHGSTAVILLDISGATEQIPQLITHVKQTHGILNALCIPC